VRAAAGALCLFALALPARGADETPTQPSPSAPAGPEPHAGPGAGSASLSVAEPVVQLQAAAPAEARPPSQRPTRRWGVGLELAPFVSPKPHAGIPLGAGDHLPVALTLRWEFTRNTAVSGGFGAPGSDSGLAAWAGYELFTTVASIRTGLIEVDLYATPGLQLGFAGPGYYARHDNVFVGWDYEHAGPIEFATRLPLGLRLRWLHRRFDTYAEVTGTLAVSPSVDVLTGMSTGVRLNF